MTHIPLEFQLDIARKSRSMSIEDRIAAGLSREEAEASFAANQEAPLSHSESEQLLTSLSVLSIGPEDTLLIKTPPTITDDQLTKLTEVLQKHFSPAVQARVMVIPHDFEFTLVTPKPTEGVLVKVGQLVGPHSP